MRGYLVGYKSPGVYRVYHPQTKTFKVSRDAIFSENEFFDIGQVSKSDDVLPSNEVNYNDTDITDDDHATDSGEAEVQNEDAAPIIHKEITVELEPPLKPLNRRQRSVIARAFKAIVKGNWKWPKNFHEAMAAEDAEDWKIAMQKEYDSMMKNGVWNLVPRPKNAKVVKSRWVLRVKDCGLHKARFCVKGFTQQ